MSRLVNFGLGEVCDRVSILSLKLLHGEAKKMDIAHFRNERNALIGKLLSAGSSRWIEAYADLAAVNATLWGLEDEIRLYALNRDAHNDIVVHCAFEIQAMNDRRAELIQQINAWMGDKVQEKV